MTAKEWVDRINAASLASPRHIIDDMDGAAELTEITTIDRDERRWYTLGTVVFRVGGEFVGVRGPISLKSETMGWADVGATCQAFEMEQVPSVTYRRKTPLEVPR